MARIVEEADIWVLRLPTRCTAIAGVTEEEEGEAVVLIIRIIR